MTTALAAISVLFLLAAGCGDANDRPALSGIVTTSTAAPQPGASIEITSPEDGAVVKGNVVKLEVDTGALTLVKPDGDTSGKTGHLHVFIDREPPPAGTVIPKEPGIVHSADNPVVLTGLHVGTHKLTVVYGDGTHARLGDASDSITVDVKGPSVDATAPPTAKAGQPVTMTVAVEGVSLVAADGDTSGSTGHLHVFIDRTPTAAGQAIPKEDGIIHTTETTITLPGMAPGEHTIWVVLGDGAHVPFKPEVTDKVVITVS
jgi:hypothetical protein